MLSTIMEVFTAAVGDTIAGNPLLLVDIVLGFIGVGIRSDPKGERARQAKRAPFPPTLVSLFWGLS